MYVFIDQSLVDSVTNNNDDFDLALETLSRIATARRKGRHLVSGSRSTLQSLSECEHLPRSARSTYLTLLRQLTQIKHLLDKIKMKVVVVSGTGVFTKSEQEGNVNISISVDNLDMFSLDTETRLLCEHLVDTKFYIKATQCYQSWASYMTGIPISFRESMGGGNTTADVYRQYKIDNEICLCILDSDKKFSCDTIGDTARRALRVDQTVNNNGLCSIEVIAHRELENLVPIKLLDLAIPKCRTKEPVINDYYNFIDDSDSDYRMYLDIKKGLKLSHLTLPDNNDLKVYWGQFNNSRNFDSQEISRGCIDEIRCQSIENCSCLVINGLGEQILSRAIVEAEKHSLPKLAEMFPAYLKADWEALAQTIFAWGCVGHKIRA